MLTQAQAQEFSYRIGNEWHAGLDIEYDGVDIGDAIAYDVMRVLGVIFLRHIDRSKGDGRSEDTTAAS